MPNWYEMGLQGLLLRGGLDEPAALLHAAGGEGAPEPAAGLMISGCRSRHAALRGSSPVSSAVGACGSPAEVHKRAKAALSCSPSAAIAPR